MGYSEKVIDHFEKPRNVGSLDKNDPNVGIGLAGAPACLTGDTLIALADGRKFARLDELFKNPSEELAVYSYNNVDGIRIRKSSSVRLTRRNADVIKVTLDDGSSFRCTPDHLLLKRDGSWIRADQATQHDSLRPFHRIVRDRYYTIYGNWQHLSYRPPEHKLIYEFFHGKIAKGNQIHHKNHIKLDNKPSNLEQVSGDEHCKHHSIHRMHVEGRKPLGRDIVGDKNPMREWWNNRATEDEKRIYRLHMSLSTAMERNGRWLGKTNDDILAFAWKIKQTHGKITSYIYKKAAKSAGYPQNVGQHRFECWNDFFQQVENFNHRVVSVEPGGIEDVYCISVEHDACFAIVTNVNDLRHTGIIVHNCGDVAKLSILVNPDTEVIEQVAFKGFGCGSLISAMSFTTEVIKGKTLDEAQKIDNKVIVEELNLPPVKIHCSVLSADVVQAAIADYRKKKALQRDAEADKLKLPVIT